MWEVEGQRESRIAVDYICVMVLCVGSALPRLVARNCARSRGRGGGSERVEVLNVCRDGEACGRASIRQTLVRVDSGEYGGGVFSCLVDQEPRLQLTLEARDRHFCVEYARKMLGKCLVVKALSCLETPLRPQPVAGGKHEQEDVRPFLCGKPLRSCGGL